MVRTRSWALLACGGAAALFLHACSGKQKKDDEGAKKDAKAPAVVLKELGETVWKTTMEAFPESATVLGLHDWDDKLTDVTDEGLKRRSAQVAEQVKALEAVDPARLEGEDKVSRELLLRALREEARAVELDHPLWSALDPMNGPQAGGFALVVRKFHPRATVKDLDNLLARYTAFGPWMDAYLARLARGVEKKLTAPGVVVDRVMAQLRQLAADGPDKGGFLVKEWPAGISDDDKKRLGDGLAAAAKDVVFPAYARLLAYLESDYVLSARTDPGLKALPNGEAIYAWLVEHHTTRALKPDELHALGLKELERVEAEMMQVALSLKHKKGKPLADFNDKLRKDRKNFAKDKNELLAAYRAMLERTRAKATDVVDHLPKVDVEVTEMDATRALSAPAAYYEEADLAGTRKAQFSANTWKAETRPLFNAEVLTCHEAIPGHHVQTGLAHELESLPTFRRVVAFSAFDEGWALYAERLCDELGLYSSPTSRYGYLSFRAWRAARLVVDTGIHVQGWDRAKAVDFMKQHTLLAPAEIDNEVDRYIQWPGQALAYLVGAMEIESQRKDAEAKLGKAFDRRQFHQAVLRSGSVTLEVLAQNTQAYVATALKAASAATADGGPASPAAAPAATDAGHAASADGGR